MKLGDQVYKVRSKNAGRFRVTIDAVCGTPAAFKAARQSLRTERVSELSACPLPWVKRFDIPEMNGIRFSIPRPVVQGPAADRDMDGAQWGILREEAEV